MEYIYIFAFFGLFALLWFSLLSLFYRFGGWYKLSQKYRCLDNIAGEAINWSSITINKGARYQRSIHITVSKKGLYLAPVKLFQIVWHKPVLIPWREITSIEKGQHLVATYYTLMLQDGTSLFITDKVKHAMDKLDISLG